MGRRSAASRKQKQKKLAARKERLLQAQSEATNASGATARVSVADVVQEVTEHTFEDYTADECSAGLPSKYPEEEFRRFGRPSERPVISIAPMMAWTDHHYRQLVRLIERQAEMDMASIRSIGASTQLNRRQINHSGRVLLVTEMLEADRIAEYEQADVDGLRDWLSFDPIQQPIAAQIGGGDPTIMANAARHCAAAGYAEVNLNIGCPSNPVCGKGFGVSLMKQPSHVASIVAAVRTAVPHEYVVNSCNSLSLKRSSANCWLVSNHDVCLVCDSCLVTVKHRLGVDNFDSFGQLLRFVQCVASPPANCQYFIVRVVASPLAHSTIYSHNDVNVQFWGNNNMLVALRFALGSCAKSNPRT